MKPQKRGIPMICMVVGFNMKQSRLNRRLTQHALSRAAKVSAGYISAIERGVVNPKLLLLGRLAKSLKLDVQELFIIPPELRRFEGRRARGGRT